ncbi:hypothetical protein ACFFR3_11155 [Nonomuraea salmonea]|jgi:hypothetical protein|uniref:Uncharacterized protein n=1 Tax=Nonomuraea salmonea TaxID=46181 RepID=A0ABV5NIE7_9ACTN
MSAFARGVTGAIVAALSLTALSAAPAQAAPAQAARSASGQAAAGSVCVTTVSPSGRLCVPGEPGFKALSATVTGAQNLSTYAARVRPAEGITVRCLKPGDSLTYAQPRKIAGIEILSSSTCVY